jgi:hypothetical protein
LLLIPLLLACFALAPHARAVCQQGCDLINVNTFFGNDALISNTTGFNDTAIGSGALQLNTTGYENTALGSGALQFNTTGFENTAIGSGALQFNTTGFVNTAIGPGALGSNTDGFWNTATGFLALALNDTGTNNTANGAVALYNNTTGNDNTASGVSALTFNTTGSVNTATGVSALQENTTGEANTATGYVALLLNTTGLNNTATGAFALILNTTGSNNTATGLAALEFNTTGSSNIALGFLAGSELTSGDNNIDIGNLGVADESNTIRIGTQGTQTATYIAGVSGGAVAGAAVKVNAAGKIGTAPSSVRFKQNVKSMGDASDALFALRPVTFRYKREIDRERIQQFGLVAEEVEKIDPNLVIRDPDGKPYSVRYEAVNAMLLNEFLKEHKAFVAEQRKVQEQGATIACLEQQIEILTVGLQKVNAQLEVSKSAVRTVLNDQ